MSRLVFARIALELVFSKLYSGIYDLYSLLSFCSWQPDLDKEVCKKISLLFVVPLLSI